MDSFDDHSFGHLLRDLVSPNGAKELANLPVPLQEFVDEVDTPDSKILTLLEIPKSMSQMNYCKSLTEKLKTDDAIAFPLSEIEPCDLGKNLYSEMRDDRYVLPDSSTPDISTEVPSVTQETPTFEDAARHEIMACLSDIPLPLEGISNNNNCEVTTPIVTPVPEEKTVTTTNTDEEVTISRPRFFQQKLKSSFSSNSTKRKADDTSICARPAKQRATKPGSCLYYPGMIVWAKITGYSYWPAMIDNDPNVNGFTWPNESTNNFSHYHVVFFDTNGRLSRSWVKTHNLKLFTEVVKISNSRPKDYIERFKGSVKEAKEALNLSLEERLKRYSFEERLKLPGTVLCQE